MFKNKILLLVLCCGVLFCFTSCYKDKGNYSYHDINEVEFDGGIDSSYSAKRGDTIRITPVLSFTRDDNRNDTINYTYEWFAMQGTSRFGLSTTRNLEAAISLPAGSYTVYYRVKDKKTGVTFKTTFNLLVTTTTMREGWLLLNEINGTTRLDAIAYNTPEKTFTYQKDFLVSAGSDFIATGIPYQVICYKSGATDSKDGLTLEILTSKATTRISDETFLQMGTIRNEMRGSIPADFKADKIYISGSSATMYAQGNMYVYNRTSSLVYGLAVNIMKSETKAFKVSPWIVQSGSSTSSVMMFDLDKGRFVRFTPSNKSYCIATTNTSTYFDYNNPVVKPIYADNDGVNNVGTVVLKDTVANKTYVARFSTSSATFGNQTFYGNISNAPDIDKAENFALNNTMGYLFYNVGGKIYEIDAFKATPTTRLIMDAGNRKISLLRFHPFMNAYSAINFPPVVQVHLNTYKVWQDRLIVGTYDPAAGAADGSGDLSFYTVPGNQGDLQLFSKYEGLGKVVSVSYLERNDDQR